MRRPEEKLVVLHEDDETIVARGWDHAVLCQTILKPPRGLLLCLPPASPCPLLPGKPALVHCRTSNRRSQNSSRCA